jgi:hypothetical protein
MEKHGTEIQNQKIHGDASNLPFRKSGFLKTTELEPPIWFVMQSETESTFHRQTQRLEDIGSKGEPESRYQCNNPGIG